MIGYKNRFQSYANGANAELQLQMFQQTELHLSHSADDAWIASQSHEINPCRSTASNAPAARQNSQLKDPQDPSFS